VAPSAQLTPDAVFQPAPEIIVSAGTLQPLPPTTPETERKEMRLSPRHVAGLAQRILQGKGLTEKQGEGVVLLVRVAGYNELQRAVRFAARQTLFELKPAPEIVELLDSVQFNEVVDFVMASLVQYKESGGIIGIVVPQSPSRSFIKNFLRALNAANLKQVAVLGNLPGETVREAGKATQMTTLKQYIKQKGEKTPVPTGVFADNFDMQEISQLLGFKIDMEGMDDPLARDMAEVLQLGAIIHASRILQAQPDLKSNAVALRQRVAQQLAKFDAAIVLEGGHFVIKAVMAKLIAQGRAEARIQMAA
jgi:hypothetical protein